MDFKSAIYCLNMMTIFYSKLDFSESCENVRSFPVTEEDCPMDSISVRHAV